MPGKTDHEPTSALLVFVIILPTFFSIFCATLFAKVTKLRRKLIGFFVEFGVIVFPIILCVTVLFDWINLYATACFVCTTIFAYLVLKDTRMDKSLIEVPSKQLGYVTLCRASTYLITSVAILAVDFKHFPYVLAKTKTYGSSLMDTGIGLFVFVSGLVCKEKPVNNVENLKKLVKSTIPILAIGVARTVIISLIGYGQDETEYGVHWNAFITLATTRVFGHIVAGFIRNKKYLGYTAIAVAVLHETILQSGLADYIMDKQGSRIGFIEANREGIYSIPGYISLYLASIHIGITFNSHKRPISVQTHFSNANIVAIACMILWGTTFLLESHFEISRRVVNAGYVCWVVSVGLTMTTLFMFMEYFLAISKTNQQVEGNLEYVPTIMEAVNYNGLAFFLLSNFLTGLVNMTLNPSRRSLGFCLLILFSYMLILCYTAVYLYKRRIKIKL